MKQYINLIKYILENGRYKINRTGTNTISIFGYQMSFNLSNGFPCITTKKLHIASIIHELIWFLRGDSNISYLKNNHINIWNNWIDIKGNLGPIYGKQWRSWPTPNGNNIDQFSNLINQIKNNPTSRRHIINTWNVSEISNMSLPPCHVLFQFYITNNTLSCQLYQRSADVFLGLPFNIASYSLLTIIIAKIYNLKLGNFIHTLGDAHIYYNHIKQIKLQINRKPKTLPIININNNINNIFDFKFNDFTLINYKTYKHITGKVTI